MHKLIDGSSLAIWPTSFVLIFKSHLNFTKSTHKTKNPNGNFLAMSQHVFHTNVRLSHQCTSKSFCLFCSKAKCKAKSKAKSSHLCMTHEVLLMVLIKLIAQTTRSKKQNTQNIVLEHCSCLHLAQLMTNPPCIVTVHIPTISPTCSVLFG